MLSFGIILFVFLLGYLFVAIAYEFIGDLMNDVMLFGLGVSLFCLYLMIFPIYDFSDLPRQPSFDGGWIYIAIENASWLSFGFITGNLHAIYTQYKSEIDSLFRFGDGSPRLNAIKASLSVEAKQPPHRLGAWSRTDQFADHKLGLEAQTLIKLSAVVFPDMNRNLIAAIERQLELSRVQKKPALDLLQRSYDERVTISEIKKSLRREPAKGYHILLTAFKGVCQVAIYSGRNTPDFRKYLSTIATQLGLSGA